MLNCTVTSTKKTNVYKKVKSITLPAYSGQMQLLSGHAESFILLKKGDVILEQESQKQEIIPIIKGECYVKNNIVSIIL